MLTPVDVEALATLVVGGGAAIFGLMRWLDAKFSGLSAGQADVKQDVGRLDERITAVHNDLATLRDNHLAHLAADVKDVRESTRVLDAKMAFVYGRLQLKSGLAEPGEPQQ